MDQVLSKDYKLFWMADAQDAILLRIGDSKAQRVFGLSARARIFSR